MSNQLLPSHFHHWWKSIRKWDGYSSFNFRVKQTSSEQYNYMEQKQTKSQQKHDLIFQCVRTSTCGHEDIFRFWSFSNKFSQKIIKIKNILNWWIFWTNCFYSFEFAMKKWALHVIKSFCKRQHGKGKHAIETRDDWQTYATNGIDKSAHMHMVYGLNGETASYFRFHPYQCCCPDYGTCAIPSTCTCDGKAHAALQDATKIIHKIGTCAQINKIHWIDENSEISTIFSLEFPKI